MRRRKLPREAFLGEIVVGNKNSKVIKPLFHERIMRTFAEIADTAEKGCVKTFCIKLFVNTFYFSRESSFSSEY